MSLFDHEAVVSQLSGLKSSERQCGSGEQDAEDDEQDEEGDELEAATARRRRSRRLGARFAEMTTRSRGLTRGHTHLVTPVARNSPATS